MVKKEKIELMIQGGKANAGPPIGPSLSGKGINLGELVSDINDKTKEMAGMDVPVTVLVDVEAKSYEIKVGVPPASALLKKEANVDKGSGKSGKLTASALTVEHIIKVAKVKQENSLGNTMKDVIKELAGTCVSLGFLIEGVDPRKFIKDVNEGKYDKEIEAGKTDLDADKQTEWQAKVSELKSAFEKAKAEAAAAAAQAK